MLQGINLEEVKRHNATLKQYKEQAATLKAEIDYTNKELDSLCAELTTELGVEVTRDNIETIYSEQVSKIQSALQSGNAVLAKIASEQNGTAQPQQNVMTQTPVNNGYATAPVQPAHTVQQGAFAGAPEPTQGTVFNGATNGSTLPPLFG